MGDGKPIPLFSWKDNMRTFSEMDKHYDRHNKGICAVCGCTTWSRWKLICDACLDEVVQEFIEKVEPKEQEEEE